MIRGSVSDCKIFPLAYDSSESGPLWETGAIISPQPERGFLKLGHDYFGEGLESKVLHLRVL